MDDERNEAVYRAVIEAVSRDDSTALTRLLREDMVDHTPLPDQLAGRAGFLQWLTAAKSSFSDLKGTVEDVFSNGDKVAGRVLWTGTHNGEFAGIPPTGRRVSFQELHIARVVDGAIVDWWGEMNVMGIVRDLTLDEEPAADGESGESVSE